MMGSGGMVVMDERTCMVDVAKFFMEFIRNESCGKCTPCREGTTRMHEILVDSHRAPRGRRGAAARALPRRAPPGGARRDRSRRPRSAASASRRPTRCSARCASSATSTRRTSWRTAARPACARVCAPTTSTPSLCTGCALCRKKLPERGHRRRAQVRPLHHRRPLHRLRRLRRRLPQAGRRSRSPERNRHEHHHQRQRDQVHAGRDGAPGRPPGRHRHPAPLLPRLGAVPVGLVPPVRGRGRGHAGLQTSCTLRGARRHGGADAHAARAQGAPRHRRAARRQPPAGLPDMRARPAAASWPTWPGISACASAATSGSKKDHPIDIIARRRSWRDPNKCVLCGRCVTMCQQVQGVGAVDFIGQRLPDSSGPGLLRRAQRVGLRLLRPVRARLPHRRADGAQPRRRGRGRAGRPRHGRGGPDRAGGTGDARWRAEASARTCAECSNGSPRPSSTSASTPYSTPLSPPT